MINKKIQDAINKQIQVEISSAYIYLGMAAHFEAETLKGMAGWMKKQSSEEMAHAMKFYDFVLERGGKVELLNIEKAKTTFKSVKEVFEETLQHERYVTASINALLELARQEKDYPFESMLKWFVDEQVEEESTVEEILAKIDLLGDKSAHLYMLDKELGAR